MRRTARLLLGLLAVVVLLAAAVLVAPRFLHPNEYKGAIVAAVQARTGRELTIDGAIELDLHPSIRPWIEVGGGPIALGQPSGPDAPGSLGARPFLRAERVQVRVKLLPLLLARRVEVDAVRVDGFDLDLLRDAEGGSNWDDLLDLGRAREREGGQEGEAAVTLVPVVPGGLDLHDGRIRWRDLRGGRSLDLQDVRIETGPVAPGAPVAVRLALDYVHTAAPLAGRLAGRLEVSAAVAAGAGAVELRDATIEASAEGGPIEHSRLELKGSAVLDLASGSLTVPRARLEVSELAAAGATGHLDLETSLRADLAGPLRLGTSDLQVTGALEVAGKVAAAFGLSGDLTATLEDGIVAAPELQLALPRFEIGGQRGSASATGSLLGTLGDGRYALQDLHVEGRVDPGSRTGLRAAAPFRAAAHVVLDLPRDRITVSGLDVSFAALETGAAHAGPMTLRAGTVTVPLSEPGLVVSGLSLEAPELRYGKLRGGLALAGGVVGERDPRTYQLRELRAKGRVAGGPGPGSDLDFDLTAGVTVEPAARSLSVRQVQGQFGGIPLRAAVEVTALGDAPRYAGQVALARFDPRAVLRRLGLGPVRTADPRSLSAAAAETSFTGDAGAIALSGLVVQVDESTLRGTLSAAGFERPHIRFKLVLDRIDADRYRVPAAGGTGAEPAETGALQALAAVEARVDLEGELRIGELELDGVRAANVRLTARPAEAVAPARSPAAPQDP